MKYEKDPKIDFVITWVDGNDPKWLEEKNKYKNNSKNLSNTSNRFRDWDNLQYWFRAIEKFTPWVNRIHFVTYGHLPKWLNTNNSKLNVVKVLTLLCCSEKLSILYLKFFWFWLYIFPLLKICL